MDITAAKLIEFSGKYVRALGHCAKAFTVGPFTYNGRSLISMVEKFGRQAARAVPQTVPKVSPDEVLAGCDTIKVCEPDAVLGNVTLLETVIINHLVADRKPRGMLEIGTFDGRTTLNLAANAPADAKIVTIDLPAQQLDSTALVIEEGDKAHIDKDVSGARFLQRPEAKQITQVYGDSATFDFSPYHGQMDLVFVDGAHSYEYVLSDTKVALDLLRDGAGVILWHDYGSYPGVTRALNELQASGGIYAGLRHIEGTSLVFRIS